MSPAPSTRREPEVDASPEVGTTTLVVEQPNYLPWIGYFDLMAQADLWVWYDDVQFTKRDWRNRNRVAREGEPSWLTIPVLSRGRFAQRLCEVEIDPESAWIRKHLRTLGLVYGGAPHAERMLQLVGRIFEEGHRRLVDLTIQLGEAIAGELGLRTRFVRSSALQGIEGRGQGRLLEICSRLGARTYLSGPSARAYIVPEAFERAGVELRYIAYDYPPYPRGELSFVPQLSIVDPLAWLGACGTARYLALHAQTVPGSACGVTESPAPAATGASRC